MRPYVVIVIQISCRIYMSFLNDSKAPKLYNNCLLYTSSVFSISFAEYLIETIHENQGEIQKVDKTVLEELYTASKTDRFFSLRKLFSLLSKLCAKSLKPIVLIIDEVDSATNNQVFLDFLAQLRGYFLTREKTPTFQSVILAGVYLSLIHI